MIRRTIPINPQGIGDRRGAWIGDGPFIAALDGDGSIVVKVGNERSQSDRQGNGDIEAAAARAPVDQPSRESDQAGTDPEKDAAGAEGDIIWHDFIPRCEWTVIERRITASSIPALTGAP